MQRRHPWIFSGAIYNMENAETVAEGDILADGFTEEEFEDDDDFGDDEEFEADFDDDSFDEE